MTENNKNIIRTTGSVCPECQKIISATIFEKNNKVFIEKECPEHGKFEDLYWGDYEMYKRAESFADDGKGVSNPAVDKENPVCPLDCGLCKMHKSHTALANIAVTNRCDSNCWYCLPGDEEILVKKGNTILLERIENIASDNFHSSKIIKTPKGDSVEVKGVSVLSAENKKQKWVPITYIFRRKYKGKFIEIRTESGNTVRTTPEHEIFVLDGEKLKKVRMSEVKTGDNLISVKEIAAPKKHDKINIDLLEEFRSLPEEEKKKIYVKNIKKYLNSVQKNRTFTDIMRSIGVKSKSFRWKKRNSMPLNIFYRLIDKYGKPDYRVLFGVDGKKYSISSELIITSEFMKLIGYFLGDGHYAKNNIWITCSDTEMQQSIEHCIKKLDYRYSILNYKKQQKAPQIVIGNVILEKIFKHVLDIPAGAANKRLPKIIFGLSDDLKYELLSGLFNADGYVTRSYGCEKYKSTHASVGIASVSKGLIRDVSYLLKTLGLYNRKHVLKKERISNKMANYDLWKIYLSAHEMRKFITKIQIRKSYLEKLKNLPESRGIRINKYSDFIVDSVKEIRKIKNNKAQHVYDIQVSSKEHSFFAGDGILVGNCFYFAERAGYVYEPTMKQIEEMVDALRAEKPVPCNALQLTGGNPELRKDLIDIIKMAKKKGIEHIQLNTQGTHKLQNDLEYCKQLRQAGIGTIYLSFDGVTPKTNPKNHWEIPGIFGNCRKADIGVVLVPTVIKSVNDHELGDILRFGFKHNDVVRSVNYQPVSLVGRMPREEREKHRITIPDAINRIEEQTDGQVAKDDFYPIPTALAFTRFVEALTKKPEYELSSHFACGMATYIFNVNGKMIPLPRFFDVEGFLEYLNEKTEQLKNGSNRIVVTAKMLFKLKSFIDKEKQPTGFSLSKILFNALTKHDYDALGEFHKHSLFVGMMHFMDLYNYDIERVKRCCIHYAVPGGKIIPFCTFNVMPEKYRDKDQKIHSIPIEQWEKQTGRSLKDELYKRDIEKLENTDLYKQTYEGFLGNN